MTKIIALLTALAFAAPLAAAAQTAPQTSPTAQKVQSTYHTNFGAFQAEAGQGR